MIRIHRADDVPSALTNDGQAARDILCTQFDSSPDSFQKRDAKFRFDDRVYAHETVKTALIKAQHDKCCFCEEKVGSDGQIEHFRPMAASSQAHKTKPNRPGYYWLAYDWGNLLLSCADCNRKKGCLFPLERPEDRARSHHYSVDREVPLLIDPTKIDPEEHIGFRSEVPYAKNNSRFGKATIDAVKLMRLNERRRAHLDVLQIMVDALRYFVRMPVQDEKAGGTFVQMRKLVQLSLEDDARYAAMARCAAVDRDWENVLRIELSEGY